MCENEPLTDTGVVGSVWVTDVAGLTGADSSSWVAGGAPTGALLTPVGATHHRLVLPHWANCVEEEMSRKEGRE